MLREAYSPQPQRCCFLYKTTREGEALNTELIFQIAGIGIIVSVMNMLLSRSGRDEQALMITIAGLVVVLMMVVGEIAKLFETVKTVFGI